MLTALDHLTPSSSVKNSHVVICRYKVGRKSPKEYTRKGDGEKILKGLCPPCSKLRKVQPLTAGAFKRRDNPPNTLVCSKQPCSFIHVNFQSTQYHIIVYVDQKTVHQTQIHFSAGSMFLARRLWTNHLVSTCLGSYVSMLQ